MAEVKEQYVDILIDGKPVWPASWQDIGVEEKEAGSTPATSADPAREALG